MPTDEELADRKLWAQDTATRMRQRCMGCGWSPQTLQLHGTERRSHAAGGQALQIHEIERRSHAAGRWAQRCNYLLLCPQCHAGPFDAMSHAQQLAYKLFWD